MTMVNKKGVDTSYANGDVNLSKVKAAGYDFVMIRCGYGSDIRNQDDTQFEASVKKAEALGMPWGVYFYTYSLSPEQDRSELDHILRLLKGKKPTMPIAVDIEDADGYKRKNGGWNRTNVSRNAKFLLEGLAKAGYYPMIYAGFEEWENLIEPSIWNKYDIWFAHWAQKCGYTGKNLCMWQYGGETNLIDGNSIAGVGTIDKDLCYKDYPTIIKEGGYNGWPKGSATADDSSAVEKPATNSGTTPTTTKKEKTMTLTFNYLGTGYKNPTGQTRTVQRILNTCNYKGKDGKKLAEDGVFGVNTEHAVKAYQAKHKLAVDGVVGAATWKALTGAK